MLVIVPTPKDKASVKAVINIETAASLIAWPTRSFALDARLVRRIAATIKNILSTPTAKVLTYDNTST